MTDIKTLDDIERGKKEEWKQNCSKEVRAQILLNKLKKEKRVNRKNGKIIQGRINELGKSNCRKQEKSEQ